ncbi:HEAT repeat domain-containing protein [Fodinibacter luteus]|uniref:HEAT repeat domain-containing protein n=1 Tax=Fodinibacter luteus TaxID=552064 RepID=A0ABP8KG60_9MICO
MTQENARRMRQVTAALASSRTEVRLAAALSAGSNPELELVDVLVARCAVESDFFVRDMLTWALTQHDHNAVVDRLLPELTSPVARARGQALHTLAKIGDPRAWAAIGPQLLIDADDEVARTAWRTAAGLVPHGAEQRLAELLGTQLGRGPRDVRLSLSQALMMLGEAAVPVVEAACDASDEAVRAHAIATLRLIEDPDSAFELAVEEAKRVRTLRGAPLVGTDAC